MGCKLSFWKWIGKYGFFDLVWFGKIVVYLFGYDFGFDYGCWGLCKFCKMGGFRDYNLYGSGVSNF